MNINSNAFFNRVEIIFYSTLISCMSGVNHVRTHLDHLANLPNQPPPDEAIITSQAEYTTPRSLQKSLMSVSQALVAIVIWMILGFSTGYLLGMFNSR